MAGVSQPRSEVEVVHAAVPGRVRIRVRAIRYDAVAAHRLVGRLTRDRRVHAVTANPTTASVLIHYDPDRPTDELFEAVAAALEGGATEDEGPSWHALDAATVLGKLAVDGGSGLPPPEARRRLAEHGRNRLPLPRRRTRAQIAAGQFLTLPTALLAVSAVVSLATGGLADALAILAVVVLNGAIGTATEARTEGLIAALEGRRRHTATVRRGGRTVVVDVEEVVPGDLLVLSPGQTVAADARLIEGDGLAMDESILTGESLPVPKAGPPCPAEAPLAERADMVWRGTLVGGGTGVAVAVATGHATEVGRIQALVGDVASPRTPLQRQLAVLNRRLVAASAALCAGVFVLGLVRGAAFSAMLRTVAALGVAAIPEGLPTVATTALALAVRELRRQGVLVRRLEVVESMGSVSTVFFDKTGTLTLNRMAVARVAAEDSEAALWEVAALCSDAVAEPDGVGGWRIQGSSTEAALLEAAMEWGVAVEDLRRRHPRLSERMRDDRRQSMATVHDLGDGRRLVAVKGSPPEVLAACRLDDEGRARVAAANEAMAAEGLRVLGFARGEGREGEDIEAAGLQWLGLVALADPPRPGVKGFIAELHRSGIDTVMLTGDQAATARAVATALGLAAGPDCAVADSAQVERLAPDELAELARRTRVFARILPGHKLKVVQAYRRGGRVVAMVGDGINDGPALKAADIGITMGRRGAQAARDLSDIVLEEDDLGGLAVAVARGRATHDNIRKAVDFMLATNLAEIAVTAVVTGLGGPRPLDPMHLLWTNLVTDVLPGLAISLEPPEPESLNLPPRDPDAPLLDTASLGRLGGHAASIGGGVLAAHLWAGAGGGAARAGTVATTAMVVAQMLHAVSTRSRRHGLLLPGKLAPNPWLTLGVAGTLAVHGLALMVPPLRRLLHFTPLSGGELAVAGVAGLIPYLVNETAKAARTAAPAVLHPQATEAAPKDR